MKKNVCMFVWNHFTNDARVLRECTTLSNNGFNVDLICIDDPQDKSIRKHEVRSENFQVFRVRRYPLVYTLLQDVLILTKKNKWLFGVYAIIWGFFLYYMFIPTLIVSFLFLILYQSTVRKTVIKANIILRMIVKGRMKKYDIFHSNDLNTLPQGYICAKWRLKKRSLVYDSHEVQTSRTGYNSSIYGIIEKVLIKRIDTMIVENHTRAKFNKELYGFYPNVLHNYPFLGISKEQEQIDLHQLLNLPPKEKIFLYQGGIQIGRGLEKIICAAPLVKEGIFVFIGDGNQKEELIKLVKEKKLGDRVKFLSKVPLKDLPKYTNNAYLGFQVLNNICFNHWSASSNKLFEYMMARVPVIACSFPEIQKVVTENNVGICVDSHNYMEIAEGINELVWNKEKRDQMSKNCVQAQEKYNWENEEEILINLYKHL